MRPTPLRLRRFAPKSRCPSRLREGIVSRYLLPSRRREGRETWRTAGEPSRSGVGLGARR